MSRVRIEIPDVFHFSTQIPIRITDINHGGHLGNDRLWSILQEARTRFFVKFGKSELDIGGVGTVVSDASVIFKAEGFYGDILDIQMAAVNFGRVNFDLVFVLTNQNGKLIAQAKTSTVAFDYARKKVASIPLEFKAQFQ